MQRSALKPYETFDIDLLNGKLREDAFGRLLAASRFEHKRDYKAQGTGNIAIEYEVKKQNGIEKSGIAITTAEWWVVEFRENCRLVVPTLFAKQLARNAIRQDRHAWIGDGKNHHNALIPFDWFLIDEASA